MSNPELFEKFAKRSNTSVRSLTKNAVIYTRVSTKEQAETNLSLETQKKYCEQFALKSNLGIVAYFGGTYESAQTDERKEFQRMLDFVKKQKEKISYIIVFSIDRFSRSGTNAMYISDQLNKQGIHILSVTQQFETISPSGKFQQNMLFMFSQFDNDLRREKTVTGMREMLKQGYWATKAPIGYDHVPGADRDHRIIIGKKGKLIQKAFHWKAGEGVSNAEILIRLKNLGLKVCKQGLTNIFKNPFYCGWMVSTILDGEVVKGKHPKLISEETFFKVNEILNKNPHGFHHQKIRIQFPLKQFLKCDVCGAPFTAYRNEKKNAEYYKCNKTGCGCNKNAEHLHTLFINQLNKYKVEQRAIQPMNKMMSYVFNNLSEHHSNNKETFVRALKICEEKTETIEEKFVLGEIERNLYEKYIQKYNEEKHKIEQQIKDSCFDLSNLDECIHFTLNLCCNLPSMWESATFEKRVNLQNLVFPEGIRYNKQNDTYLTNRVNVFFYAINTISTNCTGKKNGLDSFFTEKSTPVPGKGIEPSHPCEYWILSPARLPVPPSGRIFYNF